MKTKGVIPTTSEVPGSSLKHKEGYTKPGRLGGVSHSSTCKASPTELRNRAATLPATPKFSTYCWLAEGWKFFRKIQTRCPPMDEPNCGFMSVMTGKVETTSSLRRFRSTPLACRRCL